MRQARATYRDGLTIAIDLDQPYWIAWGIAGSAYLALQAGQQSRAARLHAAARQLLEETGLRSLEDAAFEVVNAQLRHAQAVLTLGSPQQTRARALREALSVLMDDATPPGEPDGPIMGLTPREWEVLAQLAQGLTVKEIAAVLGLSRHTAGHHVAAIRRKLGLPTRAAAVAVAVRLGAEAST